MWQNFISASPGLTRSHNKKQQSWMLPNGVLFKCSRVLPQALTPPLFYWEGIHTVVIIILLILDKQADTHSYIFITSLHYCPAHLVFAFLITVNDKLNITSPPPSARCGLTPSHIHGLLAPFVAQRSQGTCWVFFLHVMWHHLYVYLPVVLFSIIVFVSVNIFWLKDRHVVTLEVS